jgi:hypothetical protein
MPGTRLSYSPTAVRVGAGIYVLFAGWWLAVQVTGPDPAHALVVGAWLLAGGVVVHALFWRPAVVVDDDGVVLRNVLRDVQVPWSLLEGIDTRFTLTLLTPDGRHQSWAASAPGRPSTVHELRQGAAARGRRGAAATAGQAAPGGHGADGGLGGHGHALPRPGLMPGESAASRASQDLTADSGAAAFMVRQRWVAWQESHPATREAPAADGTDGTEGTGQVRVTWTLWQPLAVLVLALAGTVLGAAGL